MSKRARITLNTETDAEANRETVADPSHRKEPPANNVFTATADDPVTTTPPAWKTLPVGTIVKAVVAGLAVVSMVLIWNNRRP
jgi:hypothetical protein